MGNFFRSSRMFLNVNKSNNLTILALGGSITAGGYFMEFTRLLKDRLSINVMVHNHGHGATELTC
jgi:hypothetical protein